LLALRLLLPPLVRVRPPCARLSSVSGTSPPIKQRLAFNIVHKHSPFVWR
jgi:hypothetical protein